MLLRTKLLHYLVLDSGFTWRAVLQMLPASGVTRWRDLCGLGWRVLKQHKPCSLGRIPACPDPGSQVGLGVWGSLAAAAVASLFLLRAFSEPHSSRTLCT